MSAELHRLFTRIPAFAALDMQELAELLRAVRPVALQPDEALFGEGETGDAAFVIQQGLVLVEVDGNEVARIGEGSLLGELALVDGAPRSATVRALEASTLLRLDASEFDFLRRNMRPAAYKVLRAIATSTCARLRETNDALRRAIDGDEAEVKVEVSGTARVRAARKKSWLGRLLGRGGA